MNAAANADALLEHLRAKGVKLSVDGGYLELDAPAGVLTEELEEQIRQYKPGLLEVLEREASERELPADSTELLPAIRAMLSEYPQMVEFPPDYIRLNLTIFGEYWNAPPASEVEAALEALDVERGAA